MMFTLLKLFLTGSIPADMSSARATEIALEIVVFQAVNLFKIQ